MSVKHYTSASDRDTSGQKKAKKDWDKMTPDQKKKASKMSTPASSIFKKNKKKKNKLKTKSK